MGEAAQFSVVHIDLLAEFCLFLLSSAAHWWQEPTRLVTSQSWTSGYLILGCCEQCYHECGCPPSLHVCFLI